MYLWYYSFVIDLYYCSTVYRKWERCLWSPKMIQNVKTDYYKKENYALNKAQIYLDNVK